MFNPTTRTIPTHIIAFNRSAKLDGAVGQYDGHHIREKYRPVIETTDTSYSSRAFKRRMLRNQAETRT